MTSVRKTILRLLLHPESTRKPPPLRGHLPSAAPSRQYTKSHLPSASPSWQYTKSHLPSAVPSWQYTKSHLPSPAYSQQYIKTHLPSAAYSSRQYTKSAEQDLSALCEADLRHLRRHFLFRPEAENLPVLGRTSPPYILFSNHLRRLVDFTSLDHLGFQSDPELLSTFNKTLVENTLTDNQDYIYKLKSDLEVEIARFHDRPACIVFNHVTDVKRKLLRALSSADDVILYDECNENASLEMASCIAETVPYRHLDLGDLGSKLDLSKDKRHKMVLSDSVFPFSGECSDLRGVSEMAAQHDCLLVVDDTYGVGCLGDNLRGSEEVLPLQNKPFLLTKSLEHGIGLGTGGYFVGPEALIQHISGLEVVSDDLDLPAPVLAATQMLFQKLSQPHMRAIALEILTTSQHLRQNLRSSGFDVDVSTHPVVTVRMGQESLASTMADQLQDAGVYCYVAKHPDVPKGEARVCLSVTRHHSRDHIDHALRMFIKTGMRLKVPSEAPPSEENKH